MRKVYLDNAATTALSPRVLEKMTPYLTGIYGNASSPHSFGQAARAGVEHAREQVAKAINAEPGEIVLAGCGTESEDTVLFGEDERYAKKGDHIITTNVEHHAILHACAALEKRGLRVTYLPVDKDGLITPEQVRDAITDKTILVSVMAANNEIGTIMPIKEIASVCARQLIVIRNFISFSLICNRAVGHPVHIILHKRRKLVTLILAHEFFIFLVNGLCHVFGNIVPVSNVNAGTAYTNMLTKKIIADNLAVENYVNPLRAHSIKTHFLRKVIRQLIS